MDAHDITLSEYCQLENWPRHALPFRNLVAEYATKAQAAGPDALAPFCAVLSDFIANSRQGCVPDTESYDPVCGPEDPVQ